MCCWYLSCRTPIFTSIKSTYFQSSACQSMHPNQKNFLYSSNPSYCLKYCHSFTVKVICSSIWLVHPVQFFIITDKTVQYNQKSWKRYWASIPKWSKKSKQSHKEDYLPWHLQMVAFEERLTEPVWNYAHINELEVAQPNMSNIWAD